MIRKLSEADRASLEMLLRDQPHLNVYMLGNLAALGVSSDLSEFWGDFAPGGTDALRGVVNRYMTGWSVFGRPAADWQGLAQVIDAYPETAARLQDNPIGVASFVPYLQRYTAAHTEEEELMILRAPDFRPVSPPPQACIRPAQRTDLAQLVAFYAGAGAMQRTPKGVERPLTDGYFWVAEVEGEVCAAALTNAVGGGYAMIGGVYTAPAWRGQGFSQAVCSALCRVLLEDGLVPSLYWMAPDAGHVYRKLGFTPTGVWRSVWLQPASAL
jgi:uncharacterized protein